jgi:hypothetical protein
VTIKAVLGEIKRERPGSEEKEEGRALVRTALFLLMEAR